MTESIGRDLALLRMVRVAHHASDSAYRTVEGSLKRGLNPEPEKKKINRALARIAKTVNAGLKQ